MWSLDSHISVMIDWLHIIDSHSYSLNWSLDVWLPSPDVLNDWLSIKSITWITSHDSFPYEMLTSPLTPSHLTLLLFSSWRHHPIDPSPICDHSLSLLVVHYRNRLNWNTVNWWPLEKMVQLTQTLCKYMPFWMPRGRLDFTTDKAFHRKMMLFKITQYYRYRHRNCYRLAYMRFQNSMLIAQRHRKEKKFWMKDLFSQRIWAACDEHRFPYKYFLGILPQVGIELDRKVCAHLALWEPRTFAAIIEICKAKVAEDPVGEEAEQMKMPPGVITRKML